MKKLFLTVILMVAAGAVFGQKQLSREDELKEIATLSNTKKPEDMQKAYELGKDFIARFSKDKDKDGNLAKVKGFVEKYRENLFFNSINAKKYPEAFAAGKELLAVDPNNIDVLINLAYAGYNAQSTTQSQTLTPDSLVYAKKAVELMASGTEAKTYSPFKDKNEATAYMDFAAATFLFDTDPKEAAGYAYKALQTDSSIKASALPYYLIASYYEGVYAKLSADPKADQDRVGKSIDLMMDAYARTVKMAEAEKNPGLEVWKGRLTQVYKFRKKSDGALPEYITYINTMPLPDPTAF